MLVVGISIDGFAAKALAAAWAGAPAEEKADALRVYEAVGLGDAYPGWLGWIADLAGAGATADGAAMFLGGGASETTELVFLGYSVVITLWTPAIGILMWREAEKVRPERNEAALRVSGG